MKIEHDERTSFLRATTNNSTTTTYYSTNIGDDLYYQQQQQQQHQATNIYPSDQKISDRNDNIIESSKNNWRIVHAHDDKWNAKQKFVKNQITTTKYTFLNFVFKNLFEQFQRFANCYFLFMAILQTIPTLSPTGQFTNSVPLCFVLFVTMVKDAIEDSTRRRSDKVTNNQRAQVLRKGNFESVLWKDIKTGDIIRVENNEAFPCDLILLSSSHAQGLCYVETSGLDGETNLKIKKCHSETINLKSSQILNNSRMIVECEKPNNRLYKFEGTLQLNNETTPLALDTEQICLRGSSLKNTEFMIGISIFTGSDTKLMMNTKATPHKKSKIERMINKLIFLVFFFEIMLALLCDAGYITWTYFNTDAWYIFSDEKIDIQYLSWNGFKGFWTFLLLLTDLIPISLYVSIETAKLFQTMMISKDLKMYDEATDTPALVRSSALHEDLGQIDYIFSDKTGTLTENKMDFMKFSVSGIMYGTGITEISKITARKHGQTIVDERPEHVKINPNFHFYDERINDGAWIRQENSSDLLNFFLLLAICNTVIPEEDDSNEIVYQSSSPDEAALVKGAKHLGVELIKKTMHSVTIKVAGQLKEYTLLDVIEFSSDRKRQSIIVRDPEGRLLIMTKGADSIMTRLLNHDSKEQYGKITAQHLDHFGNEGLRTMVCAQSFLDEHAYQSWHEEYERAKISIENRQENIERVGGKIENNLTYIGATAIEDKLQQGVGDTIFELRRAGINIWMLTGDKLETAINIGYACDLLSYGMNVIVVEGNTMEELEDFLEKNLKQFENAAPDSLGLVVEGEKLLTILDEDPAMSRNFRKGPRTNLRKLFLNLSIKCKSVICCRVSPKQKSDIVLLIKNNVDCVTLAIGDGSNDVSMIQSANVGIGISGMEGLQAVNASDYAIGQFRFLKRLLLVHGRWNYRRVSKLVVYCFYKNILFFLTQLWFNIYNGYSGASLHDNWTIALYNTIFTGLPIVALAFMDRDVPDTLAEKYPELYFQGHTNRYFNAKIFIGWIVNALFHSAACFFIPYYCLVDSKFLDGQDIDTQTIGIVVYSCALVVTLFKLSIETASWTIVHVLFYFGFYLSWPVFVFAYGSVYYIFQYPYPVVAETYSITQRWRIFLTPQFYLVLLVVAFTCCLRDIFWKGFVRMYDRHFLYEIQERKKHLLLRD